MKIPNKWELQCIAFNHSSDIGFKNFMNLYKKCNAKPYSVLVFNATLTSDNPSRFRKNLLERIRYASSIDPVAFLDNIIKREISFFFFFF